MSETPDTVAGRLEQIRDRLARITAELESGETGNREAGELAAEAADLTGRAARAAAEAAGSLEQD